VASLFSESFESGTNGTTITTGNSAFTNLVQPGWTFSNAHVVTGYGSMAGKCAATGSSSIANKGTSAWSSASVVYANLPIYVEALPGSDTTLLELKNGSTVVCDLRLTPSGTIKLRNPSFTAVATSGALATVGKMARLQVKLDASAGKLQLRVFSGTNVSGSTADYDSGLVSVSGLSAVTWFQVGIGTAVTATVHYADVAFDNAAFPGPAGNAPPTCSASVSPAGTVAAGATVTLSGTDADSDGTIASRAWTQTSGTTVTLSGASTPTATFTAPSVSGGATLGFRYTVTDNLGATATSNVTVTVTSSTASIALRGSTQNTNATSGAATTGTVPSATAVGDKLLAIFFDGSGTGLTETLTASGWQAVPASAVGSNIGLHIWQKTAVSGDASSTLTVTSSVDGVSSYKRTFVVVAMAGARMGNVAGALETTARTTHTAPGQAAVSAPGSTGFTLPGNLAVLQHFEHTGGGSVSSVVAYDDLVGSGTVGGNTATGTLSTASAVMATIVLEPGTGSNPPPTAVAGADQTGVEPWSTVTVGGSDTARGTATIASILWEQMSGADVTASLSSTSTATVTFTAPPTLYGSSVILQKTVTDSTGVSGVDQVQVDALPVTERAVVNMAEVPGRFFAVL
jgi:hypothetical protein